MHNNSTDPKPAGIETSSVPSRKAYTAPVLTTYGSVTTLTQTGSGSTNEGTGSTKTTRKVGSDIRLKEHINCIGQHPLGFGIYLYDYKPAYRQVYGHGRQFGVMAQEVELVMPAAVSENEAGFKVVDYSMLGITQTLH